MALQCPECGRFVSTEFVEGLATSPGACPRCATTLTYERFHDPATADPQAASVRPPDLDPGAVRPPGRDVLEGWDTVASPQPSRRRMAEALGDETRSTVATIAAASLVGGVVGSLVSRHRPLGAAIGTLAGAGAVIAGSRLVQPEVPPGP